MPTTLPRRRARGFLPHAYNDRHRLVASLLALGFSRQDIAAIVGFSVGHVSRIGKMPQTRAGIASTFALLVARHSRNLAHSLRTRDAKRREVPPICTVQTAT